MENKIISKIRAFPHVVLGHLPTPIDPAHRLSAELGIELSIKRDDCTGLASGGNKVRQLAFNFGEALAQGADTILITGAVQSNYMRTAAAAAAKFGLDIHVQLEDRVKGMTERYHASGNVLLNRILGAEMHTYPEGEDEAGADAAIAELAEQLRQQGKTPYIIYLGPDHPPLGALGYALCSDELLQQQPDLAEKFDLIVVPSGSSYTHGGLLFGLRALDCPIEVRGICVRRDAVAQRGRISATCEKLAHMLDVDPVVTAADIWAHDDVLAPGYGHTNAAVMEAIHLAARREGLLLDPVYTGRTMAGLIHLRRTGVIASGARVLFIHTGGLPAIFAYEDEMS